MDLPNNRPESEQRTLASNTNHSRTAQIRALNDFHSVVFH
jgi:hypothetical protein